MVAAGNVYTSLSVYSGCLSQNRQGQSRISRSESAVHSTMKHFKSVQKRINTAC
uniref:Uncharacterized protein n=1 Tax=Arundo donax TaxID=35708 RepID=A0A0A9ED43_ARUDO